MGKIPGIQGPAPIQTKQLRIAHLAKERRDLVFTSLAHHFDVPWMHEAFVRTRKGGGKGVDEKTAEDFEQDLTGNLNKLLEQLKSGNYKAPPVRRIYLEKGNGRKRPIGIPITCSPRVTALDQRVKDGVLRRSIDKWLRAGVLEDGNITREPHKVASFPMDPRARLSSQRPPEWEGNHIDTSISLEIGYLNQMMKGFVIPTARFANPIMGLRHASIGKVTLRFDWRSRTCIPTPP